MIAQLNRNGRRITLRWTFAVAAAWCLAPLQGQEPAPQMSDEDVVHIGIVANAMVPYWFAAKIGAERAAREFGCSVVFTAPARGTVEKQNALIDRLIGQGINGLLFSAIDPDGITPNIRKAAALRINCITLDSDAPRSGRLLYIGTNNYEAGRLAARQMVRLLPNGGDVVVFTGNLTARNATERIRGFEEVAGRAGLRIVDRFSDDLDQEQAVENTRLALEKYPNLDGIFGVYSYNGPAAAAVLQSMQDIMMVKKVRIVCFDTEPMTIEMLRQGLIDATIAQKPYNMGYIGVRWLYRMAVDGVERTLERAPKDRFIDTGCEVITADNLDQYLKSLEKIGIKSQ